MLPDFYTSYLVEYDNANNVVYISGKDMDGFYIEFGVQDDVAEPESYAWGYADALKYQGKEVEVENITD
jgi:hypothetical protein